MDQSLIFDIMWEDNILTHVEYDYKSKLYTVANFDKTVLRSQLLNSTDPQDMFDWFSTRCFPRTRADRDILLKELGLKQYMPFEIIKITHGVLLDDHIWIKFSGETLTWENVNPRINPAFWMN